MTKNLLFITAFLICFSSVNAQLTLAFNQAKLVTSTTEIVPTGRVWKVSNYLPNGAPSDTGISILGFGTHNYFARLIRINGVNIFADHVFMQASSSVQYPSTNNLMSGGAIWLPEGTTLAAFTGVYAISVLEFNIVP